MGLLGEVWTRGYEEFHDGRFEQVEVSKKDTLDTRNDAGVVQVYFSAVKMAREHGLKIACRWEEGVFRLYKGDVMLGATVDIMHLIVMIEDEITEMGL